MLLDAERRGINRLLAPLALPLYRERPRESARALAACVARLPGRADGELLELEPAQPRPAERAVPVARSSSTSTGRAPDGPRPTTRALLDGASRRRRLPAGRRRRARRDRVVAVAARGGAGPSARGAAPPRPSSATSIRTSPTGGGRRTRAPPTSSRSGTAGSARERRSSIPRASGEPQSASRLETLAQCPFTYFLKHVLRIEPPEGARARHDRVARRHDGGLAASRGLPALLRTDHRGRRKARGGAPRRRSSRRSPARRSRSGARRSRRRASSRSASGATTSSSPAARSSRSRRSTAAT